MFERFTDRARRSLVLAQEEARRQPCNFLDTEHILLGLIAEGSGIAAKVLASFGVTLDTARQRVAVLVPPRETAGKPTASPPFTPAAKKVMERSLREARDLGHNYIGTEHLLLAISGDGQAVAAQVLEDLGADGDDVRAAVMDVLAGRRPAPAAADTPRSVVLGPSPALAAVLGYASELAASQPVSTGHVLLAMTKDARSQAAQALAAQGLEFPELAGELERIPLASTSDASPTPESVEIRLGARNSVIADPELAQALSGMSPEALREALRRAIREGPDQGVG